VNYPKIKFSSSIASTFCYSIKLQTSSYATSCYYVPKEAWVFYEKKREKKRKKKKRKRTNVPLKIKRDLAAQVLLKVFKFLREVYEISQRS
jgi:hypothetical protein